MQEKQQKPIPAKKPKDPNEGDRDRLRERLGARAQSRYPIMNYWRWSCFAPLPVAV